MAPLAVGAWAAAVVVAAWAIAAAVGAVADQRTQIEEFHFGLVVRLAVVVAAAGLVVVVMMVTMMLAVLGVVAPRRALLPGRRARGEGPGADSGGRGRCDRGATNLHPNAPSATS